MRTDQSEKAEELILALGLLSRAQELGADDDQLKLLTTRAQNARLEFQSGSVAGG